MKPVILEVGFQPENVALNPSAKECAICHFAVSSDMVI